MFIFYLLGVGLPCPSIFCQFWLCEEVQCVYLRRHLGSLEEIFYTYKLSFHLPPQGSQSRQAITVPYGECSDKCMHNVL